MSTLTLTPAEQAALRPLAPTREVYAQSTNWVAPPERRGVKSRGRT